MRCGHALAALGQKQFGQAWGAKASAAGDSELELVIELPVKPRIPDEFIARQGIVNQPHGRIQIHLAGKSQTFKQRYIKFTGHFMRVIAPGYPENGLITAHTRSRCIIGAEDRKSTRLNSSHVAISYAVFCLKKKK